MKSLRSYLLSFSWLILIIACSPKEVSPWPGFEFRLAVFDNEGNRSNVLKQGEDFWLGLELVNQSKDTIRLSYKDEIRIYTDLIDRPDFLVIYKVDPATGEQTVVGRPYGEDFRLYFHDIGGSITLIPPKKSQQLFGMKWHEPENRELPGVGKYHSSLKFTTTLSNVEGNVDIDTETKFEIQ